MLNDDTMPGLPDGTRLNVRSAKDELRSRRIELVVRCQELARFLRGFDEGPWAEWVDSRSSEIRSGQAQGIVNLLDGYSGIGNISDVFLCPEAGHRVSAGDEIGVNEQFLVMLGKVNEIARRLLTLSRPLHPGARRVLMRSGI